MQYSPVLYAPLVGVTVSVEELCSMSTRAIEASQHVCPAAGLHMGTQRAPPHLPPCAQSAGPKPAARLQCIARKAWPCFMQCYAVSPWRALKEGLEAVFKNAMMQVRALSSRNQCEGIDCHKHYPAQHLQGGSSSALSRLVLGNGPAFTTCCINLAS